MTNTLTAIGLMSGTSIDGIDIALIKSDGEKIISRGSHDYYPYYQKTKDQIKKLIDDKARSLYEIKEIEMEVTRKHVEAVLDFLQKNKINREEVDVIGFHGHTILHKPEKSISWQIGNAQMLASKAKIDVVADFRSKDIIYGGQGAPLVPIYHHILLKDVKKPVVVLNIGGVANITYLKDRDENNLVACDICFGNAPMDDLVKERINKDFDLDGQLAADGKIDHELVKDFLSLEYFSKQPPKSLDRNHFSQLLKNKLFTKLHSISLEDALATMCYIIAKSLEMSLKTLNKEPEEIIVCGGGRKNLSIMKNIEEVCKIKTTNMDVLEIDGDAVEAEAFALLAIRNLKNLPISFMKTTGVLSEKYTAQSEKEEDSFSCGGVFYRA